MNKKFSAVSLLFLLFFIISCSDNKQAASADKSNHKNDTTIANKMIKTIIFFGNSLTAGYGLEPSQAFPALIQKKIDSLDLPYKVVNAGVSGETTSGGNGRIDWILRQPIDIFVLELGANDGLRGIPIPETKSNQNITDVVIDIRYNGGGYVSVQERLANFLVSASANNNLMFVEQFNDKNTRYNSNIYFRKSGMLNLNHIYFIVSNSTASASELLINNLKPYMDVQLVGPSNTYGKPVGFFPMTVGDWYIFPVSFRSANKNGVGNYFDGLPVNTQIADGLDKDWGDVTESCLSRVLKRITTGTYSPEKYQEFADLPAEVKKGNYKLDEPLFKGSISNIIKIR